MRRPFMRIETDLSRSHDPKLGEGLKRQRAIRVYYLLCMYVFQLLRHHCVILDTQFYSLTISQIAKTRLNGLNGRLTESSRSLNGLFGRLNQECPQAGHLCGSRGMVVA